MAQSGDGRAREAREGEPPGGVAGQGPDGGAGGESRGPGGDLPEEAASGEGGRDVFPGALPGQFAIHRIYVKDVSFESPNTPRLFLGEWQPKIEIQLENGATLVEGDLYEVVLTVTVTARMEELTGFLVEVQEGGLFQASGFGEEELNAILSSHCPSILYPYAREAVTDLVQKGGFPQLILPPANFDAMFREHQRRKAEGTLDPE